MSKILISFFVTLFSCSKVNALTRLRDQEPTYWEGNAIHLKKI